jgi:hypothetical protein
MRTFNIVILALLFSKINYFAQDEFFKPTIEIGGYGELHYNHEKIENSKGKNTLDFHRFVIFYGNSWNEKWSLKAEVELEHNIVENDQGALELEQAYVNYQHKEWFGIKAGVILVNVGLLNQDHEPPLFLSVERPDYNNKIIPTTWFGNGISLYGNSSGIRYSLNIMEGLVSDKFDVSSGIRNGRQEGFLSNVDNLLYNLSIDYADFPGIKFGVSYVYNNSIGEKQNNAISLFEGHFNFNKNNLIVIGEIANIGYSSGVVNNSSGYYVDLGYNISSIFKIETAIIPFIRYTNYNPAASVNSNIITDKDFKVSKWMIGLDIKPIEEIVFKIDYGQSTSGNYNRKLNLLNAGLGYVF